LIAGGKTASRDRFRRFISRCVLFCEYGYL
jgi:hypothetical protein